MTPQAFGERVRHHDMGKKYRRLAIARIALRGLFPRRASLPANNERSLPSRSNPDCSPSEIRGVILSAEPNRDASVGAARRQHDRNRFGHDNEVGPQRPILDIASI